MRFQCPGLSPVLHGGLSFPRRGSYPVSGPSVCVILLHLRPVPVTCGCGWLLGPGSVLALPTAAVYPSTRSGKAGEPGPDLYRAG